MFDCRHRAILGAAVAFLAFAGRGADAAGTALTNCRQVVELSARPTGEASFAIRATVSFAPKGNRPEITPSASIADGTGALSFSSSFPGVRDLRPGDTARFDGSIVRNQYGEAIVTLSNITDLVHGPAPTPKDASFDEIKSGRLDDRLVRATGVVRALFDDDIDPNWQFLVLAKDSQILYVARQIYGNRRLTARDLLGATVAVTGICQHNRHSLMRPPYRRIDRLVAPDSNGIARVRSADTNFAHAPELSTLAYHLPESFPLDRRYRARGRVLAAWNGDTVLLRTAEGPVVRAHFADCALPDVGSSVEVLGFPEYNLFTLGLTSCLWRKATPMPTPEPDVTNVTVRALLEDKAGHAKANVRLHGRAIRLEGTVQSTRGEGLDRRLVLSSGGFLVPEGYTPATAGVGGSVELW